MLIRNPSKRLAIADVLRHQWFNGVSISDVNETVTPISLQQQELVLGEMQRLGIPPARVLQVLFLVFIISIQLRSFVVPIFSLSRKMRSTIMLRCIIYLLSNILASDVLSKA